MSTVIASVAPDGVAVNFKERYGSDGMNKRFTGVIPRGIHEGGELVTANSGLIVQINPDPTTLRSTYLYTSSVEETFPNRSIWVKQEGVVSLNLASVAGTTVYVALRVSYTTNSDTVAQWRTYTETELFGVSPVDEADAVIVVGKVVVPSSGPIPGTNITYTHRREAWQYQADKGRPWAQIIDDPGFERSISFWQSPSIAGADVSWVGTGPHSGSSELLIGWTGCSAAATVFQAKLYPTLPGRKVRLEAWFRGNSQPAGTGDTYFGPCVRFYDEGFATISTEIVKITASGTFAYREASGYVTAPANAKYLSAGFAVSPGGATWSTGSLFVDDMRCWVEPESSNVMTSGSDRGLISGPFAMVRGLLLQLVNNGSYGVSNFVSMSPASATQVDIGNTTIANLVIRVLASRLESMGQMRAGQELTSAAQSIVARFLGYGTSTAESPYTCMMEWQAGDSDVYVRLFTAEVLFQSVTPRKGLMLTVNAKWNPTSGLWEKDQYTTGLTGGAVALVLDQGMLRLFTRDDTVVAPWADTETGWGSQPAFNVWAPFGGTPHGMTVVGSAAATGVVSGDGFQSLTSGPASPIANRLYGDSGSKVLASIKMNNTLNPAVDWNYNVSGAVIQGSNLQLKIDFVTPFTNTNYVVSATLFGDSFSSGFFFHPHVESRALGYVILNLREVSTAPFAGNVSWNSIFSANGGVLIDIKGRQ